VTTDGQAIGASPLRDEDVELIRSLATLFIDVVRPFSDAMAIHIHEQVPALGGVEDKDSLEATRASCEGNLREIFSMIRADLSASAHETPVQALKYARFLRTRGWGYDTIIGGYQYGVAMFRFLLAEELPSHVQDPGRMGAIGKATDDFLFAYIANTLERLLSEYDLTTGAWHPSASDPVLANTASQEAARHFRDEQMARGEWLASAPEASQAHTESEKILETFAATIEEAANHPELLRRLAMADTTVEVSLADEPDLCVTLLLDRTPIEVVDGPKADAEVRIQIASFDLNHVWSVDFQLPMAIVRGRVKVGGPVRKFLRVVPILRPLARARGLPTGGETELAPAVSAEQPRTS
jgi:hypothetical protein